MEQVFSISGFVIGIAGLIYAIFTNRQKAKLEHFIKVKLQRLAGNVQNTKNSANYAFRHCNAIRREINKATQSDETAEINRSALLGASDAQATLKMLENILNDVLGTQEGLFKSKEIQFYETYSHVGAEEN